LLPVEIEPPT